MGSKNIFKSPENDNWDKALAYMRAKLGLVVALSINQTENSPKGFVSERHIKSGLLVKFWQRQLYCWAMTQPELVLKYRDFEVSGAFSSKFSELIKDFQLRHGLEVDGVIGPSFFRAFLTRYFFDESGRNLGRKGFEERFFPLISEEEYLRVISKNRRNDSIKRGLRTTPLICAEQILSDKTLLNKFTEIYNANSDGKAPISAKDFLELCKIYRVDPCLALAQGIIESRLGTRGLAVKTKNIFNVGNTDDGRIRSFNSFQEGMIAYLETMQKYFATTREEFSARNGRNLRGGVYATSRGYVKKISDLAKRIQEALKKAKMTKNS